MRRSPWGAVLVSVVVMVLAATSTYLPWRRIAPLALHSAEAAWSRGTDVARDWIGEHRFAWTLDLDVRHWPRLPATWEWAGGGVAVVLLGAMLTLATARRRRTRPRVLRLAHQGEPVPAIARRFGLSQDAVRLLTSPMLDPARSGVRRGNNFRVRAADTSAPPDGERRERRATR